MQTPTPEHISAITSQHHGRVSRDMARSFLSGLAEGTTPKEAAKLFNSELGKKHGRTSEWQAERANVNAKVRAITARHGGRVSRQTAEEFIMAHPELDAEAVANLFDSEQARLREEALAHRDAEANERRDEAIRTQTVYLQTKANELTTRLRTLGILDEVTFSFTVHDEWRRDEVWSCDALDVVNKRTTLDALLAAATNVETLPLATSRERLVAFVASATRLTDFSGPMG